MLPASALDAAARQAGFRDLEAVTWDMDRELEEWLVIVSDPTRSDPVQIVVHALAEAGRSAGIGLSIKDGKVAFLHRWMFLKATKPSRH
jgi:hypothetical protein